MGNILVEETTMAAIADSIRERGGTDGKLKPAAMPQAILDIPAGGTGADESLPVRFFDYDGTLLYSYSLEELQGMAELPALPVHEGLVCQGWNWSLEGLKAVNREMNAAAVYITDDGATRLYVHLEKDNLDPVVSFSQSVPGGVQVDWGDGSGPEASPGETGKVTIVHSYENSGDYLVRILPEEGCMITLAGTSKGGGEIFSAGESSLFANMKHSSAVRKAELGKNIELLDAYCFYGFSRMESISMPADTGGIGRGAFRECRSLRFAGLPETMDSIQQETFKDCSGMRHVSLPDGILSIPGDVFSSCADLMEITLPDCVETLGGMSFVGCSSLRSVYLPQKVSSMGNYIFKDDKILEGITVPESTREIPPYFITGCYLVTEAVIPYWVEKLSAYAFYGCQSIRDYYFMPEAPPVLNGTSVFGGIQTYCKIHVPKGCLEAYQAADNWSNYAGYMVEMEEGEVH